MNIATLSNEYLVLQDMLEDSLGEVTPEIEAYMDTIKAKTVNGLFELQNVREAFDAASDMCKKKADEWSEKAKRMARSSDNVKKVQIAVMQMSGNKSLTNGAYKITLTQNPLKVNVVDETAIPSTYLKASVEMTAAEYEQIKNMIEAKSVKFSADKKSIAEIYKATGIELAGCEYTRDDNVRVS